MKEWVVGKMLVWCSCSCTMFYMIYPSLSCECVAKIWDKLSWCVEIMTHETLRQPQLSFNLIMTIWVLNRFHQYHIDWVGPTTREQNEERWFSGCFGMIKGSITEGEGDYVATFGVHNTPTYMFECSFN